MCIFSACQLIPHKLLDDYEYDPDVGTSLLWKRGLQLPIQGMYHSWLGRLLFAEGMDELQEGEEIQVDVTAVMVKVYPSGDALRLDVVEIMN